MVTTVTDKSHLNILESAMEAIVATFEVTREEITGRSRVRRIVYARHAFCSLVQNEFNRQCVVEYRHGIPFAVIGGFIGRDHSTALYASSTSHENNMGGRNSDYIPFYYKARALFSEMILGGLPEKKIKLSEIEKELTRLRNEKKIVLEQIKQQKQL